MYVAPKPDIKAMDKLMQGLINQHVDSLKHARVYWVREYDHDGDLIGWMPYAEFIFKGQSDFEEDLKTWAERKGNKTTH